MQEREDLSLQLEREQKKSGMAKFFKKKVTRKADKVKTRSGVFFCKS